MKPKKPLIPYFGGKWKLAAWVVSYFPPHRVYVEAFGGAGSVLMNKEKSTVEVYNELNAEITNLFKIVRDPETKKELARLLHLTPYSRNEWKACMEFSKNSIEQARRTMVAYIMSRHTGKVPNRGSASFDLSTYDYQNPPRAFDDFIKNLDLICERLRRVLIEEDDAFLISQRHDRKECLHYWDPPYLKSTRKDNQAAYLIDYSSSDYHKLIAKNAKLLKGMVIISGYNSPLYKELFEDDGWHRFTKMTTDGSGAKKKSKREESIWVNKACYDKLPYLKF